MHLVVCHFPRVSKNTSFLSMPCILCKDHRNPRRSIPGVGAVHTKNPVIMKVYSNSDQKRPLHCLKRPSLRIKEKTFFCLRGQNWNVRPTAKNITRNPGSRQWPQGQHFDCHCRLWVTRRVVWQRDCTFGLVALFQLWMSLCHRVAGPRPLGLSRHGEQACKTALLDCCHWRRVPLCAQ